METTSTEFIKVYDYLYNFNELNSNDITLLSFIITEIEDKKDFFYTDEEITKHFNNILGGNRMISRIIKKLKDNDFIITERVTIEFIEYKSGNRRLITLGSKLNK
jgi:hypothetical protein